jgi:hypothetical protein
MPVLTDARLGYSPLRGIQDVGEGIETASLYARVKRHVDDHALLNLLNVVVSKYLQ